VTYNGGYGYVYGTYIEIKEKVIALGTSKGVNVRQGPSGSTEKLGYLSSGEEVEIVGEEGSYYKIKYKDSYGYVYGTYVEM
jgi:probable enterotoxin B